MNKYHKVQKPRYNKKRQMCIDLLGGVCVVCGTNKNLEFDHIDRNNVGFRIGANLWKKDSDLIEELKKCQLLCREHHLEKTNFELNRDNRHHGSASMYSNHGCRCIMCTEAWSSYIASRRNKK